ncbi:MAG: polyprenyl synthetase family protein, partial [Opitutales bacterium]|nr:polyprenyl synthetase family protein [Opitutales bacterium]
MNNWHYSKTPFSRAAGRFKRELSSLGSYLLKQAASFEREVRAAAKEAIAPRGKYIRPLLVFSAAPAGAKKDSLVRRAAIAELVHLSTLIHDDVIDRADMRRNRDTAFKKYGAKTAVLLGDAIFAHMMTLAFEENSMEVLEKTASCVRSICSGEIRQTLADNTKIVPRKKYYDVAYGKTAALFELSCRLGAGCGEAPKG